MVPDGVNNTYMLEIDGGNCYNVGGGNIAANTWVWIDYRDSVASSKVQQTLSGGNHSVKLIGNKANVKIDRLIAVSDLTCVPTGMGDNCNAPDPPADGTPPAVSLSSPQAGATVSGDITLAANATDNVGVTKVEFYTDTALVSSDTTSPYSVTVATTDLTNGSHLMSARAYDAAGNVTSDSRTVTVMNGDSAAPSVPTSVKATATAYNKVSLTWNASLDNVGVTGYNIVRNGITIAAVGAVTSYEDLTTAPNTAYSYQVSARDAAGNKSALSIASTTTTPTVPDTQAPSAPTGLVGTAVSTSQINLVWSASADNVGVVSYDVYRGAAKIATVSTTSYGDTGLQASTQYSYSVRARDAAGNVGITSDAVSVTTKAPDTQTSSLLNGTVRNRNGRAMSGVTITATPTGTTSRIITRTATDGTYVLNFPSSFSGQIQYSKTGYRTQTVSLTVDGGQVVTRNVTLFRK